MTKAVSRAGFAMLLTAALAAPLQAQDARPLSTPRSGRPSGEDVVIIEYPLSLAQAVSLARDTSATAELARLRQQEAVAKAGQARAVFLPSLGGSAMMSNRTFNLESFGITLPTAPGSPPLPNLQGPVDLFDARLKVSQTVFDPAGWARFGAAHRGVDVARADFGSSIESASQNAALAYLRAARAKAVVDARVADSTVAYDLVQLADAQERAGTTPGIEAIRAHAQLVATRGALIVAQNQLDRANIDLARALGVDPVARFALTDTLSAELGRTTVPEDAAQAVTFAVGHRPDLALESARLARARADRSAIGWETLGRLDASADYGASGLTPHDAIGTREVMVAWNVPFFDGLRREERRSEQTSVMRESEVRARDLRSQIAADINGALADLASGRAQEEVAAERMRLAQEELRQARVRFQGGIAGSLELVNAESTLVRARDADIDARFAIAAARVAVARAAGIARDLH